MNAISPGLWRLLISLKLQNISSRHKQDRWWMILLKTSLSVWNTVEPARVCLSRLSHYFSVHGDVLRKQFRKKAATALHVLFTKNTGCKTFTSVKPEKLQKRKNINRKQRSNKIRILRLFI